MESLHKLQSPRWPEELFGPIDQAKAARGKTPSTRRARRHETYTKTGDLNEYQLFPLRSSARIRARRSTSSGW
jgi:hypothetical protein